MKKFIFSLIILVGSFSAYADVPVHADLPKSHHQFFESYYNVYLSLGDLFKTASAPDIKKLVGVTWTGRCFNKKQPNTPTNGGYIFRVAKNLDTGPIGREKEKTYEAASYWNPSKAPNYYDTMTFEEIKINFYLSKIKFYEDSISIDLTENQTSELRIAGEYLIEEIRTSEDVGSIKKNTYKTEIRCYYSKYSKK